MKFAKRLDYEAMPEWRNEYIAYKELKKVIKRIHTITMADRASDNSEDGTHKWNVNYEEVTKEFEETLGKELAKVEKFFTTQLHDAIKRKKFLFNQLRELIKQFSRSSNIIVDEEMVDNGEVISMSANTTQKLNSNHTTNSNNDKDSTRKITPNSSKKSQEQEFEEVISPFQQTNGIGSTHINSSKGSDHIVTDNPLSLAKQIKNLSHIPNKLPSLHYLQYEGRMLLAKSHIKRALLELYNFLIILSSYQKINTVAYTKIVKKFEKNYIQTQEESYNVYQQQLEKSLNEGKEQLLPSVEPSNANSRKNNVTNHLKNETAEGETEAINNDKEEGEGEEDEDEPTPVERQFQAMYHKIHSVHTGLMQCLLNSPLYKDNTVNHILRELDAIFHNYFPKDSTYQQLVQDRQVANNDPSQFHVANGGSVFTSMEFCKFLGGFLCGINFLSLIYLMHQYTLNDQLLDQLKASSSISGLGFQNVTKPQLLGAQFIYFALGLPILLGNGVIANMYLWQYFKINYRLIFGCTHSMLPIHYTILIACYTLFYLQYVINSLSGQIAGVALQYQPMVLAAAMVGLTLLPGGVFFGDSRAWWNKAVFRLVVTPYYSIQFKDFFIADQWMSIMPFFAGVGWLFAYTFTGTIAWNTAGTMPATTWYTILLMLLPPWLRCIQCLRRYWQQIHDATATTAMASSTAYLHLVNCMKYLFSILTVVLPGILAFHPTNTSLPHIIISIRLLSTLYSLLWDIVMDFGLGQMRVLPASPSAVRLAEVAAVAAASSSTAVYNTLLQYIPVPQHDPFGSSSRQQGQGVVLPSLSLPVTPSITPTHLQQQLQQQQQQHPQHHVMQRVQISSDSLEEEGEEESEKYDAIAYMTRTAAAAPFQPSTAPMKYSPGKRKPPLPPSSSSLQANEATAVVVSLASMKSMTKSTKSTKSNLDFSSNSGSSKRAEGSNSNSSKSGPQMMIYPVWFYYAILMADAIMRLIWLPLLNNTTFSPTTILFFTASCEVLRRVAWNIFRAEIEHVHNCIAERVIDTTTVTLPFITEELYHGYN